jgi:hypothetical protein
MAGLRTQEVFGKMRACVAPMGSCYMYMRMHMHMYRRKCNSANLVFL